MSKDNAEDKKIISVRIKRKPEPKPESSLLYSEKDIRRFVSEFVSSWIRGDIIIRFPTAAELAKKTPLSIAFPTDPSVNAELKIKEHYVDFLSVIAGIKTCIRRRAGKSNRRSLQDAAHVPQRKPHRRQNHLKRPRKKNSRPRKNHCKPNQTCRADNWLFVYPKKTQTEQAC